MILDEIQYPSDLKSLKFEELELLCQELKDFVRNTAKTKEGHINSSIAVTELSVALHRVFDTPNDVLIWDVGHQAYIHKILTGRKENFDQNRMFEGLSGFTRSSESEYDPFGAGHSSTSISAATGFALASRLRSDSKKHIAVIGDGAITGGMSFEALNHLGEQQLDVLVVLNDNQSSIDANVGALAEHQDYQGYCNSLGVEYLGEVDGHDLSTLLGALQEASVSNKPRLLRVLTQKSKSRISSSGPGHTTFQTVFAEVVEGLALKHPELVVVSPAMLSGAGLKKFRKDFPERTLDVGIAEQHAVTMAAGMAASGLIPLVHLYSTFAQRAFDQIIHDVALQDLHMVFCLDRAGLVGQDGATHHGVFDPGFLNTIPNLTIASPMNGDQLAATLSEAVKSKGPWVIRYPKSACEARSASEPLNPRKVRELRSGRGKAVLSFGAIGNRVHTAMAESPYSHYDFSFLKPFDRDSLLHIASQFEELITIEENSARGGLGDTVRAVLAEEGITLRVRSRSLPDEFVEQGRNQELYKLTGLDVDSLKEFIHHS